MNEHFRSFSVLEEEKKDSNQKTKSSKKIPDQDLISTEKDEEKVRHRLISYFYIKKYFLD